MTAQDRTAATRHTPRQRTCCVYCGARIGADHWYSTLRARRLACIRHAYLVDLDPVYTL